MLKHLFNSLSHPDNPVVFFDVCVGDSLPDRIYMELYADVVPKTAENFRQLCTGETTRNGIPLGYKRSTFHRIIQGFMMQGGDFLKGDGTGSYSIYGESFSDENFILKHNSGGLLSMANSGPNTNGCQFFITTDKCEWLDGKHVVFGRLADVNSMSVVKRIEKIAVDKNNRPLTEVYISECGQM